MDDSSQALYYYQQALPVYRELSDQKGEAKTLGNMGWVYEKLKDYQEAIDYYKRVLPLLREVGDTQGEASTFRDLSNLAYKLEEYQEAIDYDKQALLLFRGVGDTQEEAATLNHIGANPNIRQGVDPKLLEQEQRLQQQLNTFDYQKYQLLSNQHTQQQLDEIKQKIDTVLTQLDQLKAQIRTTSPRYADLKYPQPLNLQEIQQQVLDEDTLLLEYSLGEDSSYLWLVSKNSITSYVLP